MRGIGAKWSCSIRVKWCWNADHYPPRFLGIMVSPTSPGANRDFDFLLGTWRRRDRRLRRGLSGSSEWQELEGTSVIRPLWDGEGNIEFGKM